MLHARAVRETSTSTATEHFEASRGPPDREGFAKCDPQEELVRSLFLGDGFLDFKERYDVRP